MKIGLIAMSGVRAHNKELTQLGLTLPGFVDRNRIVASLPSLGLLTQGINGGHVAEAKSQTRRLPDPVATLARAR